MDNKTSFNINSKYLLITSKKNNFGEKSYLANAHVNTDIRDDSTKYLINPKVKTLVNDKSRKGNKAIYEVKNIIVNNKISKHSSISTKEWGNSVYAYNKNYAKNLPIASSALNNILTGYFNISPMINGKPSNSRIILERKNSLNKTLVSKSEVKITNDKVNLTVYIYSRNKETILRNFKNTWYLHYRNNLLLKNGLLKKQLLKKQLLKKQLLKKGLSKRIGGKNKARNFFLKRYAKSIISRKRWIKRRRKLFLKSAVSFMTEARLHIDKIIKSLGEDENIELLERKGYSSELCLQHLYGRCGTTFVLNYFSDHLNTYYARKMLYLYYIREIVNYNKKFKNWFLLGLKKKLTKLYNKKIELNIVNQKYFYLNSDIFTKAIATRVRDRNNRILNEIKMALKRVSLAKIRNQPYNAYSKVKYNNNLELINKVLKWNIFSSVRYKHIQGVSIQGAGRLSLRLTAARSLFKKRKKGSLLNTQKVNINLNKSFSLLRGDVKPNVQYTNLNAKTRNGAFGLKGWISSN